MHENLYTIVLLGILLNSCSFPTTKEAEIKYSTEPAFKVPKNIEWREVGLAKELINIKEKLVIISGGSNPLPLHKWEGLNIGFHWQKITEGKYSGTIKMPEKNSGIYFITILNNTYQTNFKLIKR